MLGGNQDAARGPHTPFGPFVAATTSPESLYTPVECLWGSVRRPCTLTSNFSLRDHVPISFLVLSPSRPSYTECVSVVANVLGRQKKSRRGRTPKAFDHVGLLVNEPPGSAELLFI